MKNDYELRGEITAIFIKSPKYGTLETVISSINVDRVKEFPNTWCVTFNKTKNLFYVVGKLNNKTICLHRFITEAPEGMEVDHINHDTLDNTNSNLRVVTVSENQQNRIGATKTSKSGIRGVSWNRHANKWSARVKINGKHTIVGYFNSVEEAESAVIMERSRRMPFSKEASA